MRQVPACGEKDGDFSRSGDAKNYRSPNLHAAFLYSVCHHFLRNGIFHQLFGFVTVLLPTLTPFRWQIFDKGAKYTQRGLGNLSNYKK